MNATPSSRTIVANYASSYLPITENWIYHQLINFKQFKSIFLTRRKKNLELFPIENLISLDDKSSLIQVFQLLVLKFVGYIPMFKTACRAHDVRILHIHFGYHGVKMLGLKKVLHLPMVCSFYGDDAFASHFIGQYKNLFAQADKILVLGAYMQKQLVSLGCPESKIAIHHLGIDVEEIKFQKRIVQPTEPVRFLIASSFVEKKGVDVALKALGVLASRYDFKVDIIGDGPLKPEITDLIEEIQLNKQVELHGYKPYQFVIDMAYQCHVFIQASKTTADNRKEGTPMAIADVMATGMAVVATKHSDIPEMVIDGETGLLADENNVDSLRQAIQKLLDTPDLIGVMAMNGRSRVEKEFNVKIQANRLEEIFKSLITI